MNYTHKKNMQDGFTLVEILIAVALMLVLGAVVTYSYRGVINKNKRGATITSMKNIRAAIDNYKDDIGEYPSSLRDLVAKPTDEKAAELWHEAYLDSKNNEAPKDAWKNPFVYNVTEGAEHPYELYSYGKNGKGAPKSEWIDAWKQ
jgi:general secretion pathway protein G